MPEEILRSDEISRKERAGDWHAIPILIAGAAIIGGAIVPTLFGKDSMAQGNAIGMLALMGSKLVGLIVEGRYRQTEDASLTDRVRTLTSGSDYTFGRVRIDETILGLKNILWSREKDDIVISRYAVDNLTAAELDFALASAACRRTIRRVPESTPLAAVSGCFIARFLPLPEKALIAFCLLAFLAFVVTSLMQYVFNLADSDDRSIAADDAAMKLTRDRDAAESAIEKLYTDSSSKAKQEARLRNIRNAAFREQRAQLPPYGWKPTR